MLPEQMNDSRQVNLAASTYREGLQNREIVELGGQFLGLSSAIS